MSFSRIATDPDQRARVVELLRSSSEFLDGTAPRYSLAERAVFSVDKANRLRELASLLCDHGDIRGSRCRYCDSPVREQRA